VGTIDPTRGEGMEGSRVHAVGDGGLMVSGGRPASALRSPHPRKTATMALRTGGDRSGRSLGHRSGCSNARKPPARIARFKFGPARRCSVLVSCLTSSQHDSGALYQGTASAVPAWDILNMAFRPCNRAIASWVFVNELQRRDTSFRIDAVQHLERKSPLRLGREGPP
jgi:hypothetical protein